MKSSCMCTKMLEWKVCLVDLGAVFGVFDNLWGEKQRLQSDGVRGFVVSPFRIRVKFFGRLVFFTFHGVLD